jgi:hypothetical protein
VLQQDAPLLAAGAVGEEVEDEYVCEEGDV